MERQVSKLYTISDWREGMANVYFNCPGCLCSHGVWTIPHINGNDKNGNPVYGPVWTFNNDFDKPTFTPSLKITYPNNPPTSDRICHSYVTNGMIQFLGDCTHKLVGQTVELPEI